MLFSFCAALAKNKSGWIQVLERGAESFLYSLYMRGAFAAGSCSQSHSAYKMNVVRMTSAALAHAGGASVHVAQHAERSSCRWTNSAGAPALSVPLHIQCLVYCATSRSGARRRSNCRRARCSTVRFGHFWCDWRHRLRFAQRARCARKAAHAMCMLMCHSALARPCRLTGARFSLDRRRI